MEGKLKKEFKWFRLWVKIYRSPETLLKLTGESWDTLDRKGKKLN